LSPGTARAGGAAGATGGLGTTTGASLASSFSTGSLDDGLLSKGRFAERSAKLRNPACWGANGSVFLKSKTGPRRGSVSSDPAARRFGGVGLVTVIVGLGSSGRAPLFTEPARHCGFEGSTLIFRAPLACGVAGSGVGESMSIALGLGAPLVPPVDRPGVGRSSLLVSSSSTKPAVPAVIFTGFAFFTGLPCRVGETDALLICGGTKL
jgi:hypothetical protein